MVGSVHRDRCVGGDSSRETPGPNPNPEAKPGYADGTALGRVWESRTPPDSLSKRGLLEEISISE